MILASSTTSWKLPFVETWTVASLSALQSSWWMEKEGWLVFRARRIHNYLPHFLQPSPSGTLHSYLLRTEQKDMVEDEVSMGMHTLTQKHMMLDRFFRKPEIAPNLIQRCSLVLQQIVFSCSIMFGCLSHNIAEQK